MYSLKWWFKCSSPNTEDVCPDLVWLEDYQSEKCAKSIFSKSLYALNKGALTTSTEQFRFLEFRENID